MPESAYDIAVKRLARLWNTVHEVTYGEVFDTLVAVLRCKPTDLARDVLSQRRVNAATDPLEVERTRFHD